MNTRKYNPGMKNPGKKFYELLEDALKSAKTRAKTSYRSQYIYAARTAGYYIRSEEIVGFKWTAKVKFDGTVEYQPTEKEESEIQES